MLEGGKPATPEVVKHIDRCLSCLSCMTTCPSGVHYMHLVDHARAYIEETYKRPWHDRLAAVAARAVLPYPSRFRLALAGGDAGASRSRALSARLPHVGARLKRDARPRAARAAGPLAVRAAAASSPSTARGAAASRSCRAAPSRC